jgi:hypothetical protein
MSLLGEGLWPAAPELSLKLVLGGYQKQDLCLELNHFFSLVSCVILTKLCNLSELVYHP